LSKKIILSGNRPTGLLHWGNYTGALENWVKLQDEYNCFFMVADWHVLTTALDKVPEIKHNSREMILDWLAAGLDPDKSVLFIQSEVKEHAELFLIFSMMISMGRLERNPTFKEQIRDLNMQGEISFGHLGYPVLQAADILAYRANAVPVGEDQLPHIELTREIARRYNHHFGKVFPEPEGIVTKFSRFPGTDGKRMSKSLGNTIALCASEDEIRKGLKTTFTDPDRLKLTDPGNPDICAIFSYYKKFAPADSELTASECRNAARGCVACKNQLADSVVEYFSEIRERRLYFEQKPKLVDEIIENGNKQASEVARETLLIVRDSMGIG
jgi:tryptophanyl-tRNA synthetase